jgi:hypothetical protein
VSHLKAAIDQFANTWVDEAESQLYSFIRQCPSSKTETTQTLDNGTVVTSSKILEFIKQLLLNEQPPDINDASIAFGFSVYTDIKILCRYTSRAFIIDPFTMYVHRPSKPMLRAMQAFLLKAGIAVDDSAIQN